LAFAFAVGHGAAQAADTAAISVSPGSATASVGDDVTLDINVANVPTAPGLGGYVIVVQWDPAVLQLTSLADAGWVTGGNIIVVCDAAAINNTAGNAELDCTPTLAFGTGVTTTAPHVVAQAVFHAKAPGTTAVNLTGSSVMNPSNIALTSTISGGSVTVAAAAPTPNATATVQPKATPATVVPTSTPAAQATSTSAAIPATPSTKPTETTLSKVEVPQTGSGTAASGGTAWRMPVLAVALAVLLAAGGAVAFRRAGKNNNGG
jgi:hypothetical protein